MYEVGMGVEKNPKEVFKWYKKAAEQGHAKAQHNLGFMYVTGKGVKQNKILAYKWWLKAAKQGESTAQRNLDILCKESPWACKQ
jgi:TPR repeat protein